MDKELFLAGFDLNEDSTATVSGVFNATLGANFTSKVHTVELMGVQCGKECYAISVASVLTFLAGVYQVKEQLGCDLAVLQLKGNKCWVNVHSSGHF